MLKLVLPLLLASATVWATTPEEVAKVLSRHAEVTDTIKRVDLYSQSFLGLPYGAGGPLGEGPDARYDQDPLYRFDTFDCTTYVETVVALAHSQDVPEFLRHIDEIRYENGVVDYTTRNHFPSLDWIPNNIANGFFTDITRVLAVPGTVRVASAVIDKPNYYRFLTEASLRVIGLTSEERAQRVEEWRQEGARFSPETATLDYVPIDWIAANPKWLDRVPHGVVVNFVRPNWDLTHVAGTHMNVSHQAFLVRKDGKLMMRHAPSAGQNVTEVLFLDYVRRFVGHATLKGVHFLAINPR